MAMSLAWGEEFDTGNYYIQHYYPGSSGGGYSSSILYLNNVSAAGIKIRLEITEFKQWYDESSLYIYPVDFLLSVFINNNLNNVFENKSYSNNYIYLKYPGIKCYDTTQLHEIRDRSNDFTNKIEIATLNFAPREMQILPVIYDSKSTKDYYETITAKVYASYYYYTY